MAGRAMASANPLRIGHSLRFVLRIALLLLGSAFTLAQPASETPLTAVVIERIQVQPISDQLEFSARVEAIESVDIRARVQGFLQTIAFAAGQSVTAGELLFEIEPGQYEAGAASARAQLSQAQASQLEATRTLARVQALAKQQSVSRAALDEAQANADIAAANVEAAQAGMRNAELNLSYTHITAPITGEIGRSLFTQGNLVGPDSGPLARVIQLDPIRVVFSISEGLLVTLRQQTGTEGAIDPRALRFSLRLPNDADYPHPGRIEYIAQEVDPQTGTVAVRVVFPNPEHLLLHNQYVTIVVAEAQPTHLPVVPQPAVLQDREGRFVYVVGDGVVGDGDRVSRRRIEIGSRVMNGWAVTEGLRGGEAVVVQGTQRLSEGMQVRAVEAPRTTEPGAVRPSGPGL